MEATSRPAWRPEEHGKNRRARHASEHGALVGIHCFFLHEYKMSTRRLKAVRHAFVKAQGID